MLFTKYFWFCLSTWWDFTFSSLEVRFDLLTCYDQWHVNMKALRATTWLVIFFHCSSECGKLLYDNCSISLSPGVRSIPTDASQTCSIIKKQALLFSVTEILGLLINVGSSSSFWVNTQHLLSIYHVLGTLPSISLFFFLLIYVIITIIIWRRILDFIDEWIISQRYKEGEWFATF